VLKQTLKTKLIYRHILTGIGLVILALSITVSSPVKVLATKLATNQEYIIIERTNQLRNESGLPDLVPDNRLMTSATNKAIDMAERGYFSHANPEGLRMSYWIHGANYYYSLAGENLAKGFTSIDRLMKAWADSPSHCRNLLENKFTNIGVGIATKSINGQEIIFVVQHFGVEKKSTKAMAMIAGDISQTTPTTALTTEPVFASLNTASLLELTTEDTSSDRDAPINWLTALLAIMSLGIIGYTIDFVNIDRMKDIIYSKKTFKPFKAS